MIQKCRDQKCNHSNQRSKVRDHRFDPKDPEVRIRDPAVGVRDERYTNVITDPVEILSNVELIFLIQFTYRGRQRDEIIN